VRRELFALRVRQERIAKLAAGTHDASSSMHALHRDEAGLFEQIGECLYLGACRLFEGEAGNDVPGDEVDLCLERRNPAYESSGVVETGVSVPVSTVPALSALRSLT